MSVFLFALVLGGVLLAVSLFGGEHHGGDHGDAGSVHGELAGFAAMFVSLRFWTFFSAFFGLTGVLVHGLELVPGPAVAFVVAAGVGATAGGGASWILRRLGRDDVGAVATAADMVGTSARVLLPIRKGELGKVRLELKGTTVDLLAETEDERTLAVGDDALIVEIRGTRALVQASPIREVRE